MTTEYWLQKKTIGGWSHVTSYTELEQAQKNYASCVGKERLSGYSWRLVEVKTIQEDMLNDVTPIPQPYEEPLKTGIVNQSGWGQPVQDAPKSTGWGQVAPSAPNRTSINPSPTILNPEAREHGLCGSVWLVHYGLKDKKRVAANLVDDMIAQGWQRGGPRTQFEG